MSEVVSKSSAQLKMPNEYAAYVELYCDKSTVWLLIPLAYNLMLMVVCAMIGFVTRKLPENFNESWLQQQQQLSQS